MILVCGEALIDLFAKVNEAGSLTLDVTVGGSPLNLAIGLARLGTAVAFFGGVSLDRFGDFLARTMVDEGIDTSLLRRSARATPLVLVGTDASGHPSYTFYAHETAAHDVSLADVPDEVPAAITAIALGSYTLAVEPMGSALLALAEREATARVISLDCNLRSAMVGPLGRWRERIDRFTRTVSIIKLSDEDFSNGWADAVSFPELAASWLARGALLVILTHGAKGATAWFRSGTLTLPSVPVDAVDAVGAGDSFQAALLARLSQRGLLSRPALSTLNQASVEDALRYANITAGLTCGHRGAHLPRRREVDQALLARASL